MDPIDTIKVSARRQVEVAANGVHLHVSVKGSNLFTGNAALSKAKEVQQLVLAVQEAGLREEDIKLQGVHAASSSGVFGRSTAATYQLRLRCLKLELLPEVLGAVTGQKNATMERLTWQYPDTSAFRANLLAECLREAKANAQLAADTLEVGLLGVHRINQAWSEPGEEWLMLGAPAGFPGQAKGKALSAVELGFNLSHEKLVTIEVKASFRVSSFRAKTA